MIRKEAEFVPIDAGTRWEKQLLLSSIPLKRLSENMEPEGSASGCMIDYCGLRLILTVSHATLEPGGWALELECAGEKGMKMLPLPAMHFLGRVATKDLLQFLQQQPSIEKTEIVDFSYGVIPSDTESIHEQFGEEGKMHWKAPRTVFKLTFNETPTKTQSYGFSGHTQIESCPHPTKPQLRVLCATQTVCADLKYIRTEGDMHFFKLGGKHPGHHCFMGCSGAPIINRRGQAVALVAGGDTNQDTIRGVSLRMYKAAIDIEVRNLMRGVANHS
jgi:hypothetical protein